MFRRVIQDASKALISTVSVVEARMVVHGRRGQRAVVLVDAPQALLTMLYRSTDRLRRCGAPMKNLAHSASFHSRDKPAPSNPGTKHLD